MSCSPRLVPSASLANPASDLHAPLTSGEKFWWACRFKLSWNQKTEPDMGVDLLLAQAVMGPILESMEDRLLFWRFHRRAAPDDSGHQFSFLFYSDVSALQEINAEIQKNPTLHQALKKKIVERATCDNTSGTRRPEISAMSDASWSPALQKHWPAFIMGVSRLWLGLINEALRDLPPHEGNFDKKLEQIRKAEKTINMMWYKEGQHAFFHHLSAVFGYEPLLIKNVVRF